MTLSQLMQTAHALKRDYRCTMSVALRMSWGLARGFSHAFEIAFVDSELRVSRQIGFAGSSDAARAAYIAAESAGLKRGVKSLGGISSINLSIYRPAAEVEAVQPAMKRAA